MSCNFHMDYMDYMDIVMNINELQYVQARKYCKRQWTTWTPNPNGSQNNTTLRS